jgi:hypothetical protein
VLAVDTTKKARIGNFKNPGREWPPKGAPEAVNVQDVAAPHLGQVMPYGGYELAAKEGWVNGGIDHDSAEVAVESIRRWWFPLGTERDPHTRKRLMTADCGGSPGSRTRLGKGALQQCAAEREVPIHGRHFPPGTRKGNKIGQRLFCFITQNWRGRPLLSRATGVNLIASTPPCQGFTVRAMVDERSYETGKKVADEELAALKLKPEPFHGEWNYRLLPRPRSC